MPRTSLALTVLLAGAAASACGGGAKDANVAAASAASAPADPGAAAAPSAASSEPAAPASAEPAPPRKKRPLSIHSSCPKVATVVFGDDPKAPDAGKRTIAPNSSIEGPRDDAGKVTVWLLDDSGAPVIKVHVTRGIKEVEIGRSCSTLDAH